MHRNAITTTRGGDIRVAGRRQECRRPAIAATALLAILAAPALAATSGYWIAGEDALFSNSANWSGNAVPDFWWAVEQSSGHEFTQKAMNLGATAWQSSEHIYFNNGTDEFAVTAEDGGGLTVAGKIFVSNNSIAGNVKLASGSYSSGNDLIISDSTGSGTMTIAGGATLRVGASTTRWTYLANNSGSATLNLDGGTFLTGSLRKGGGAGSATVNFNGGTLATYGAASEFTPSNDKLTFNVKKGGAIIHTDYAMTIAQPFASGEEDDGGLTKRGAGTLTLSGANTYTGATVIEGGTVVFGSTTATSGITLKGGFYKLTASGTTVTASPAITVNGGKLIVDVSSLELEEGSALTLSGVTIGEGATAAGNIVIAGKALDWTPTAGADGITFAASAATGANKWVGATSGEWNTAGNWQYGVPASGGAAVFESDATVTLTEAASAGSITLADGVTLTLASASELVLTCPGIAAADGGTATLAIARGAQVVLAGTSVDESVTINAIGGFGAKNTSRINGAVSVAGTVWFFDNEGYTTFDKSTVVNGSLTFASGATMTLYNSARIMGDLIGPGTITLSEWGATPVLGGDNSKFTGTYTYYNNNRNRTRTTTFASPKSGSASASWSFDGDVFLGMDSSTGATPTAGFTGTIAFGTLNANGTKMFKLDSAAKDVVVEVGAGAVNSQFFIGEYDTLTPAGVTLKKVGAGALAYSGYGFPKIEVAQGTLTLGTGTRSHSSHVYTAIDSISVAAGATLAGYTELSIADLAFAEGAYFKPTVGGTTLTATAATVEGAIVQIAGGSGVSPLDAEETYTILSATTLTGKPVKVAQGEDGNSVAASDAKTVWLAKAKSDGSLVLLAGLENPGLIMIVR